MQRLVPVLMLLIATLLGGCTFFTRGGEDRGAPTDEGEAEAEAEPAHEEEGHEGHGH